MRSFDWVQMSLPRELAAAHQNADALYRVLSHALDVGCGAEVDLASQRLLELEPASERAIVARAVLLIRLQRGAEAERQLRAWLDRHGDSAPVLLHLAKISADRSNEEQALAELSRARAIDPAHAIGALWFASMSKALGAELPAIEKAAIMEPHALATPVWSARLCEPTWLYPRPSAGTKIAFFAFSDVADPPRMFARALPLRLAEVAQLQLDAEALYIDRDITEPAPSAIVRGRYASNRLTIELAHGATTRELVLDGPDPLALANALEHRLLALLVEEKLAKPAASRRGLLGAADPAYLSALASYATQELAARGAIDPMSLDYEHARAPRYLGAGLSRKVLAIAALLAEQEYAPALALEDRALVLSMIATEKRQEPNGAIALLEPLVLARLREPRFAEVRDQRLRNAAIDPAYGRWLMRAAFPITPAAG